MATALTETRNDVIDLALRKMRIIGAGDNADSDQISDGTAYINFLIKSLDGHPALTDKRDTDKKQAAISSGDNSVSLDAAVVHVEGAQFVQTSDGAVYSLTPMTRLQHIESQNDKTTPTTGEPEQYYVTNQNGTRKMYIYPAVPGDGNIEYWSTDAHDIVSTDAVLDIPDSYHMWLVFKLAEIWSFDFGKRLEEIDRFRRLAADFWPEIAKAQGEEPEKSLRDEEYKITRGV